MKLDFDFPRDQRFDTYDAAAAQAKQQHRKRGQNNSASFNPVDNTQAVRQDFNVNFDSYNIQRANETNKNVNSEDLFAGFNFNVNQQSNKHYILALILNLKKL